MIDGALFARALVSGNLICGHWRMEKCRQTAGWCAGSGSVASTWLANTVALEI